MMPEYSNRAIRWEEARAKEMVALFPEYSKPEESSAIAHSADPLEDSRGASASKGRRGRVQINPAASPFPTP
jgi:hypothetical protein